MSTPVPRVRFNYDFTPIGSDLGVQQKLYHYAYEGLLVSEPHWRRVNRKTAVLEWSGGGPFYVHKESLTHYGITQYPVKKNGLWLGTYTIGGVIPNHKTAIPALPVPASWSSVEGSASSHYASGYSRARPGNPVASLGQFLVELRDLPQIPLKKAFKGRGRSLSAPFARGVPIQEVPRILFKRLDGFRGLGSEYLNVVFGWAPFVRDLQQMYNLWKTLDKRLAQLVRENGKYIRRRATIQDDTVNSQTEQVYNLPFVNVLGSPPNYMTGRTQYTVTTRTKTKIWFSGSFRYYVPDIGSSQWTTRATAALFGALPTPELLWEVLPWSWLIDWFSNIGDVVSNASVNAVDNLTTRYSFIMKHVTTSSEATSVVWADAKHSTQDSWNACSSTFQSRKILETKVRVGGGNPFGLNVSLPSLSPRQFGILAALGLSRQKLL